MCQMQVCPEVHPQVTFPELSLVCFTRLFTKREGRLRPGFSAKDPNTINQWVAFICCLSPRLSDPGLYYY